MRDSARRPRRIFPPSSSGDITFETFDSAPRNTRNKAGFFVKIHTNARPLATSFAGVLVAFFGRQPALTRGCNHIVELYFRVPCYCSWRFSLRGEKENAKGAPEFSPLPLALPPPLQPKIR